MDETNFSFELLTEQLIEAREKLNRCYDHEQAVKATIEEEMAKHAAETSIRLLHSQKEERLAEEELANEITTVINLARSRDAVLEKATGVHVLGMVGREIKLALPEELESQLVYC